MTSAGSRWPGRLLAAVDGVLFGWFLMLCHALLMELVRLGEFTWNRPESELPALTQWVLAALPDEFWSLSAGWIGLSVGFGLFCLYSTEAASSRLFRWACIGIWTAAVGIVLPIFEVFKNLRNGPDQHLWDEVLFVALAALVVFLGAVRLRRRAVMHRL